MVGLLYRKFYNFSPPAVLLRLYLSLVRPLLEYASVVWSPYLKKDILQLKNVQKFGLCMATKLWAYPYDHVLYRSQLNSLEIRRTITRLCTLFKIRYTFYVSACASDHVCAYVGPATHACLKLYMWDLS